LFALDYEIVDWNELSELVATITTLLLEKMKIPLISFTMLPVCGG
jgi:hypothetical protein